MQKKITRQKSTQTPDTQILSRNIESQKLGTTRLSPVRELKQTIQSADSYSQIVEENPDQVAAFAWLYKETVAVLDRYERVAREGKELEAALTFARYLQWSGIIKMCTQHQKYGTILKCDGINLQWRVREIIHIVGEQYKNPKTIPHVGLSEVEKINHKLDLIAGILAQNVTQRNIDHQDTGTQRAA